MNEHSSHPCCHLLSRAIEALGKSVVPVVSKPMVLVALHMVQVVIMCPLSPSSWAKIQWFTESCIPWFPSAVAKKWRHLYKQALKRIRTFIADTLKRLLSFPFSEHPTPLVFCVLSAQRTCVCVMGELYAPLLPSCLFLRLLLLYSFLQVYAYHGKGSSGITCRRHLGHHHREVHCSSLQFSE